MSVLGHLHHRDEYGGEDEYEFEIETNFRGSFAERNSDVTGLRKQAAGSAAALQLHHLAHVSLHGYHQLTVQL
jgi:hypothetical protein